MQRFTIVLRKMQISIFFLLLVIVMRVVKMTRGGEDIFFHRLQVWFGINLSRLIINISNHELVFQRV